MRLSTMTILALMTLFGGGCQRTSTRDCPGACKQGFVCNVGACSVEPFGLWVLTVTTGQVQDRDPQGESWDFAGGEPDPKVCLTINGLRECTVVVQDSTRPIWHRAFAATTANTLRSGVKVEFVDDDATSDDAICGTEIAYPTEKDFDSGAWRVGCQFGHFDLTLTPMAPTTANAGSVNGRGAN